MFLNSWYYHGFVSVHNGTDYRMDDTQARTNTNRYEYSSIHNGRYRYRIRILLALLSQPSLEQACHLENAAYTQWVAHADH